MRRVLRSATLGVAPLLLAPTLAAAQASVPPTVEACYVPVSGTIYRVDSPTSPAAGAPKNCLNAAHVRFTWNRQGPQGPAGPQGPVGPQGPAGTATVGPDLTLPGTLSVGGNATVSGQLNASGGVSAQGGLVAAGAAQIAVPSGGGRRFMWIPQKAAVRGGQAIGDGWDDANIGLQSTAFGVGTIASGHRSMALGNFASTNGMSGATVIGDASTTSLLLATADNEFAVRAAGGIRLRTRSDLSQGCDVSTAGRLSCTGGFAGMTLPRTASNMLDLSAREGWVADGGSGEPLGVSGAGTRSFWYPGKAAFRAGAVTGTEWDDANIGTASLAIGISTIASGGSAIALGNNTVASGNYTFAAGRLTRANGTFSVSLGGESVASGLGSLTLGTLNSVTAAYGAAMGRSNTVTGDYGVTIGTSNRASALHATALGSRSTASGPYAIAFGETVTASGEFATAIGHQLTASGRLSVALGNHVSTNGRTGTFAYGDASTTAVLQAGGNNQFIVRAAGGTVFYSNAALTGGVSLPAGGGSWTSVSDVRKKTAFRPLDGESVLTKLRALPVESWQYTAQAAAIRHIGPTAQDFRVAFGVGESDTTITSVDADGVALAAAKALEARTRGYAASLAELRAENAALRLALDELRQSIRAEVAAQLGAALQSERQVDGGTATVGAPRTQQSGHTHDAATTTRPAKTSPTRVTNRSNF